MIRIIALIVSLLISFPAFAEYKEIKGAFGVILGQPFDPYMEITTGKKMKGYIKFNPSFKMRNFSDYYVKLNNAKITEILAVSDSFEDEYACLEYQSLFKTLLTSYGEVKLHNGILSTQNDNKKMLTLCEGLTFYLKYQLV